MSEEIIRKGLGKNSSCTLAKEKKEDQQPVVKKQNRKQAQWIIRNDDVDDDNIKVKSPRIKTITTTTTKHSPIKTLKELELDSKGKPRTPTSPTLNCEAELFYREIKSVRVYCYHNTICKSIKLLKNCYVGKTMRINPKSKRDSEIYQRFKSLLVDFRIKGYSISNVIIYCFIACTKSENALLEHIRKNKDLNVVNGRDGNRKMDFDNTTFNHLYIISFGGCQEFKIPGHIECQLPKHTPSATLFQFLADLTQETITDRKLNLVGEKKTILTQILNRKKIKTLESLGDHVVTTAQQWDKECQEKIDQFIQDKALKPYLKTENNEENELCVLLRKKMKLFIDKEFKQ